MLSPCEYSVLPKLDKVALKKLAVASILCFIFMVGEVIGGYIANSLAIATDAAHLLVDLASFIISMVSVYLASRPPGRKLNFGWHRAETIGALLSIVFIWGVTAVLVYMAVLRLLQGTYEINATVMLITAGIGLAFNIFMAIALHGVGNHHHHHNHNHQAPPQDIGNAGNNDIGSDQSRQRRQRHGNQVLISQFGDDDEDNGEGGYNQGNNPSPHGVHRRNSYTHVDVNTIPSDVIIRTGPAVISRRKTKPSNLMNINVRAAFIHVLGDILQSVGVLVASLIIFYRPQYKIADPICTFVFSVLVVLTTIRILYDTVFILMNACPRNIKCDDVRNDLLKIPYVEKIHNLRLWHLSNEHVVASMHLILKKNDLLTGIPSNDQQLIEQLRQQHDIPQKVLKDTNRILKVKYSIVDVTTQVEPWGIFDEDEEEGRSRVMGGDDDDVSSGDVNVDDDDIDVGGDDVNLITNLY